MRAQAPPPSSTILKGKIEGTVLRTGGNEPLPGARVGHANQFRDRRSNACGGILRHFGKHDFA